ncbi:MAG: two-component system, NarL family, invasion response regulator UvrY [Acidobacteriota bacterium]|jgi:DNA-binding NarL/FixJ family response regulator|nr:two-component system, NarL family, invasion response regulator UvrY [Acidobacteriota bacterium]
MTRIVIADDHAVVRKGLRLILADADELLVAGEAASADELLTLLRTRPVDAVILDVGLGDRDGIEVLKQIRASFPRLPVLMMSMYSEDVYAIRALRSGASGYIEKSAAPELLLAAVRRVAAGGKWVSAAMTERLTAQIGSESSGSLPHERLSDREFEVFRLLGNGNSVTEIARALNLSVKTVSTHRMHILAKTGLETNAGIVDYVISNGLR